MKRGLGFLFLGILVACSSNGELSQKRDSSTWNSAGLSVDYADAENIGTGIETVTSVGDYLFARNDRRIEGKRRYQLFQGKVGSLLWQELELPDGDVPNVLFADSGRLYVGTFFSAGGARLWIFDPERAIWTNREIPVVDERFPVSDSAYGIDGIAKFRGRLVLSFSHGMSGERNPLYFESDDGSWNNWNRGFPAGESFLRAEEWNGSLFAMTYGNGIYRFDLSDTAWHPVSAPTVSCENGAWNDSSMLARDAAIVEDGLLVGYANLEGVFSLSSQGTWRQKMDCILLDAESDVSLLSRTPASVYRFVPFRDRYIALGEGSAIYAPGENRWNELPPISGVTEILDGTIAKDTLYVAAFQKGVMKLSTAFLDSIIHSNTVLSEVTK